jgi:hypothetical protein
LERQTRQGWNLSRLREQVLKVAATLKLYARRITIHLGAAADKWWPTPEAKRVELMHQGDHHNTRVERSQRRSAITAALKGFFVTSCGFGLKSASVGQKFSELATPYQTLCSDTFRAVSLRFWPAGL